HAEAIKFGINDTALYDAFLPEAEGDPEETQRRLSTIDRPEARSACFNSIAKQKGTPAALAWLKQRRYSVHDLGAAGSIGGLLRRVEVGDHKLALGEAEALPSGWFEEFPALRTIRANLLLAAILPTDQRGALFQGLPVNPRMLQFASIAQTP